MTIREEIIREVVTTEDTQLLRYLLDFLRQRHQQQPEQPRKGSYEAFMRLRGTLSEADAQEMTDIIDREFNAIEGEW